MATTEQIIEHLRKLSAYKERPECDSDGMPYYADCGNFDDAYGIGETDGGINLAKALIDALDNDASLPDLPALDYEDEDEDEEHAGSMALLPATTPKRAWLALKKELHELRKLRARAHPVKVGEYVKNDNGDVCQVHEVYAEEYLLNTGWTWAFENCTPCDPPTASHDTPAGKETAQAAAEPKPGDVVRLGAGK